MEKFEVYLYDTIDLMDLMSPLVWVHYELSVPMSWQIANEQLIKYLHTRLALLNWSSFKQIVVKWGKFSKDQIWFDPWKTFLTAFSVHEPFTFSELPKLLLTSKIVLRALTCSCFCKYFMIKIICSTNYDQISNSKDLTYFSMKLVMQFVNFESTISLLM